MLRCDEALTLVRHIREDDGDRYECVPVTGSWHRKQTVAISEAGAKPVSTCSCRIPAGALPEEVIPAVGDFLVHGTVTAVSQAPGGFASLDYMQITSIGDNQRGRLQHWRVEGA